MMNNSKVEDSIVNLIVFLINVGLIWATAWWFNPNLTSGTVWFFAISFAIIITKADDIQIRIRK